MLYQKDKHRTDRILTKLGFWLVVIAFPGAALSLAQILPGDIIWIFLIMLFCAAILLGWFGSTAYLDENIGIPLREDLLRIFIRLWSVPDKTIDELKEVNVIAPLSYGTLKEKLTQATENHLIRAIWLWKRHQNAVIIIGNAANCFPGSEAVEERLKREILTRAGIPENAILQDVIKNTVTEAWSGKDLLKKALKRHDSIVVITGLLHSRSARYIWRKVFWGSKIYLYCPWDDIETQPDQIIFLLQSLWRWVFANVARQIFLRVFGLDRTSRFVHPTKKPA